MARLHFSVDYDYPLDRTAVKSPGNSPAPESAKAQRALDRSAETVEFDLDKVFEEPSRRPF